MSASHSTAPLNQTMFIERDPLNDFIEYNAAYNSSTHRAMDIANSGCALTGGCNVS